MSAKSKFANEQAVQFKDVDGDEHNGTVMLRQGDFYFVRTESAIYMVPPKYMKAAEAPKKP